MLKDYRAIRAVATRISEAADATIDAYRKGRVTDEPHITDRLMGTIEEKVRDFVTPVHTEASVDLADSLSHRDESIKSIEVADTFDALEIDHSSSRTSIRWEAKTLRSGPGSAAEEKHFGADILGVLSINAADYQIDKGFLAQAKRAEPGRPFSNSEWDRLISQCEAMLISTPDAFVMAYSKAAGVRFFSAQAVVAYGGRDLFDLYHLGPRTFFELHLQSFVGDHNLNRPDISVLKELQARRDESRNSMHVLQLKGLGISAEIIP